jgi:hypothetical protein
MLSSARCYKKKIGLIVISLIEFIEVMNSTLLLGRIQKYVKSKEFGQLYSIITLYGSYGVERVSRKT